ncbi:MAG: TSUP family transporter [Verrucomicrobiota bacterium]|nr:TSUP family transporter [Verrucomicrobiota bacterium]
MEPLALQDLIVLFLCGGIAGFIDSIAGGGGLISLPMLLSVGLPPQIALGTNKLQSTFGSLAATINYARQGLIDFRGALWGVVCTAIGAVVGAIAVQLLDKSILTRTIPLLLTAIFFYVLFSPRLGEKDMRTRLKETLFYPMAGLLLGFYDGFFGPGVGTFWTIAFVTLLGYNLKRATGHTKLMNFTSNAVSLVAFALAGKLVLVAGFVMGFGQLLGAWSGSHLVIKKGTGFIRAVFLAVVGVTIVRLLTIAYLR